MAARVTYCTIATPGAHLAQARVMTASLLEQEPRAQVTLLLIGDEESETGRAEHLGLDPQVEVLEPDDIEEPKEVRRMGLMYSTQGLACAMKPRLLRHLVRRQGHPVLLIDSDIYVCGPLGEIARRAEGAGALLTTHVIRPLLEAERPMLLTGLFNAGFTAIGERGAGLLDWWCERTARDCVLSRAQGLQWEQGWLGLAPAFFDVEVLRDPGVNTMGRELLDQDVEWRNERPQISGRPLRCYHFSGPYDPRRSDYVVAPKGVAGTVSRPGDSGVAAGLSWLDLGRRPGAARLSREYAARLLEAGYGEEPGPIPYQQLPGGVPLHRGMRRAYRSGLREAERSAASRPPNPFLGETVDSFLGWLAEPPSEAAHRDGITRFALGTWEALEGAQTAFPRVPGRDTEAFLRWASNRADRLGEVPPQLAPGLRGRSEAVNARGRAGPGALRSMIARVRRR